MSVFLNGDLKSAQQPARAEGRASASSSARYADNPLRRLAGNTPQSIETSSLHLDLITDLKRINSHICSIAYPILESAGVLSKTRVVDAGAKTFPADEPRTI